MNSRDDGDPPSEAAQAHGPCAERPTDRKEDEARLESEGERAADSGRSWHTNPYLRKENMPTRTGETLREWARKHDAWQRGFEGNGRQWSRGAAKEELAGEMLMEMLRRRLAGTSSVRLEMERNRWSTLRVSAPRRCERDHDGRNWDVSSFECGSLNESVCRSEFRVIVDELRDRYDIR